MSDALASDHFSALAGECSDLPAALQALDAAHATTGAYWVVEVSTLPSLQAALTQCLHHLSTASSEAPRQHRVMAAGKKDGAIAALLTLVGQCMVAGIKATLPYTLVSPAASSLPRVHLPATVHDRMDLWEEVEPLSGAGTTGGGEEGSGGALSSSWTPAPFEVALEAASIAQKQSPVDESMLKSLDRLCGLYGAVALQALGLPLDKPGASLPLDGEVCCRTFNIDPLWARLMDRLLSHCLTDGLLTMGGEGDETGRATVSAQGATLSAAALEETYKALIIEYSDEGMALTVLHRSAALLPLILRGEADLLSSLAAQLEQHAEAGDDDVTPEAMFASSPYAKAAHATAAAAVVAAVKDVPTGRRLKVLEVGGGAAGLTHAVLDALTAANISLEQVDYHFTDVSPLFLHQAKQHLPASLQTSLYDMNAATSSSSAAGGKEGLSPFPPHLFDVILCGNVLHLARDVTSSLQQLRRLLAPDGLCMILELTRPMRWLDLTFGATPQWWSFTDTELRTSPLLSAPQWKAVCAAAGFAATADIAAEASAASPQTIILARGPYLSPHAIRTARSAYDAQVRASQSASDAAGAGENSAVSVEAALAKTATVRNELVTAIYAAPLEARGECIQEYMALMLGACLGSRPEAVDRERPLAELGFDSLIGVEVRNIVRAELNRDLPVSEMSQNPNLNELAEILLRQVNDESKAWTKDDDEADDAFASYVDDHTGLQGGELIAGSHPFILGMGTANPPNATDQMHSAETLISLLGVDGKVAERLRRIYANSGIKTRHGVFSTAEQVWTGTRRANLEPGEKALMEERNYLYMEEAQKVAYQSCTRAIEHWGGDRSRITHVLSVSCTGTCVPGIEFRMAQQLGLSPTTERLSINFMGCFGGLSGLKTAKALAEEDPSRRILVVCTELCSLHFSPDLRTDNIVGGAIFADGSAAAIVGGNPTDDEVPMFELARTASVFIPDSADKMAWDLGDYGWKLGLSPDIPELLCSNIRPFCRHLIGDRGISFEECHWPLHPGGKAIVEAIERTCKLERSQTQATWDVLADNGNMSSCTILFVLKRLAEQLQEHGPSHKWAVTLAFGPGLSMEGILCRPVVGLSRDEIYAAASSINAPADNTGIEDFVDKEDEEAIAQARFNIAQEAHKRLGAANVTDEDFDENHVAAL